MNTDRSATMGQLQGRVNLLEPVHGNGEAGKGMAPAQNQDCLSLEDLVGDPVYFVLDEKNRRTTLSSVYWLRDGSPGSRRT